MPFAYWHVSFGGAKKNVCDYAQFRLSLFKVRLNALAHGHHTPKTMRRGYPAHKICILCPKWNWSKTNDRCLLIARWSIVQMILATAIANTLRFVCGTWDEFSTQNPNTTAHKHRSKQKIKFNVDHALMQSYWQRNADLEYWLRVWNE